MPLRSCRSSSSGPRGGRRAGAFALACLAAAGCGGPPVAPPAMPAPTVLVATPVVRPVTGYVELTGTAQASAQVELRAQVSGYLAERLFEDGQEVKAGQELFVIDEEPYRVRLEFSRAKVDEAASALRRAEQSKARETARAQLDLDQTAVALAELVNERRRELVQTSAVATEELDRSQAELLRARAQLAADRAALEQAVADYETNILGARAALAMAEADVRSAEIELAFCRIKSPIDGKINARVYDVGNYIDSAAATGLATVVQVEPMYAYLTPSQDEVYRIRNGVDNVDGQGRYRIEMGLGETGDFPHVGYVDYIEPSVDAGTGTVRVRGVFEGVGDVVIPGLFVRLRIPAERDEAALLVSDRAIGSDQGGSFVYVVNAEDVIERRSVAPGTEVDGMRVVRGKIAATDRVVVDGLLKVRPEMPVTPKAQAEADAEAAAKARAAGDAGGPPSHGGGGGGEAAPGGDGA